MSASLIIFCVRGKLTVGLLGILPCEFASRVTWYFTL